MPRYVRFAATLVAALALTHETPGGGNVFITQVGSGLGSSCEAPAAHGLHSGAASRWPCAALGEGHAAQQSPSGSVGPRWPPNAGGIAGWGVGFGRRGAVPPKAARKKLPARALVAVGMDAPGRLTVEMLSIAELLRNRFDDVGPVHLVLRAGAHMSLMLFALDALLTAAAVVRIDFELSPWGLRCMGAANEHILSRLLANNFEIFAPEEEGADWLNVSALIALTKCEGGFFPTRLVARYAGERVSETQMHWASYGVRDTCCWQTPFRGRNLNAHWMICCSPHIKPRELCYQSLPVGRDLQFCCGESSPVKQARRVRSLIHFSEDLQLGEEVMNTTSFVESWYLEEGFPMGYREPSARVHGRHMKLRPVIGHGPKNIAGLSKDHGLSISQPDIECFVRIRDELLGGKGAWSRRPIFIIGNGFGFSTLVLSRVFPGSSIDVIDSASDDDVESIGLPLTQKIIVKKALDIRLYVGFSPQSTHFALRAKSYDLVFIDGQHYAKNLILDFAGVLPYLSSRAVVVCHDIALTNMNEGVRDILLESARIGSGFAFQLYTSFNFINDMGTGFFHRGFSVAELRGFFS